MHAAHVRVPAHVDIGIYFVKISASAFFDDQSFRFQIPASTDRMSYTKNLKKKLK